MKNLPKGMIPDKDNVIYYDTEKQMFYPTSGREDTTMCCLPCYNKVMYPLWDNIQKLKKNP